MFRMRYFILQIFITVIISFLEAEAQEVTQAGNSSEIQVVGYARYLKPAEGVKINLLLSAECKKIDECLQSVDQREQTLKNSLSPTFKSRKVLDSYQRAGDGKNLFNRTIVVDGVGQSVSQLRGLEAAGFVIQNLNSYPIDKEALKKEAYLEAVKDAQVKAELLASASNLKLALPKSIVVQEEGLGSQVRERFETEESQKLAPSEIEVTVTVVTVYGLLPK